MCLLVWFRSRPPPFPPTPSTPVSPFDHPPRCFVLLFVSPGCDSLSLPPRQQRCSLLRPAFISQQNLRDGTPVPTTINEKLCTKCITTSHVPAAKGHALTSRFFPYLLLLFFCLCSLLSSLSPPDQPAGQSSSYPSFDSSSFPTVPYLASPFFLLRAIILAHNTGRHLAIRLTALSF